MSTSYVERYDVKFDFVRFIKFLQDNNIVSVAIASVISDRINELTNSFVSNLVMPILNRDADKDGERDIKTIEDKVISFSGITFGIGKVVVAGIKFIVITYLIFVMADFLKKYTNRAR